MKRGWVAVAAVFVLCLAALLSLGAENGTPVGKFQAAAPDLIADTTTGRVVDSTGRVVQEAASSAPKEIGRYQAAGFVKVTPKQAGWDVYGRTFIESQVEKGLILIDTTTGSVIAQRVYSSEAVKSESSGKTSP
jgi:hypothetical protein